LNHRIDDPMIVSEEKTGSGRAVVVVAIMCTLWALPVSPVYGESESAAAHEATYEFHPNMAAFFVGVTSEDRREKGGALGVAYERRLNESFGVGALAEYTAGDLDFLVFAVPFVYHTGPWKLYVAPGVESSDHGEEFMFRLAGEYGFEVASWEISPQLAVDLVDGDQVFVLGVVFGKGF
jgi:hypothetical protein